jgi:flagellar biosynthesis protein FlhG
MIRMTGDQAEGLRCLQAKEGVRIITVASGGSGVGKTSAVVNLAVALAKNGKDVLVLDENPCHNNVCANLGIKARYDLLHVINRDKTLEQVILRGPEGISILPALRGVNSLAKLQPAEQKRLIDCFDNLQKPVDVVLVDAAAGSTGHVLSMSLAAQEVLMVLSPSASAITGAYSLIKLMSQEYAKRHFRILVNKAGSETEAKAIFDNVYLAAQRYLSVSPDFMGFVPLDNKLRRSAHLSRAVVEAFPASASAVSFRKLAAGLQHWSRADDYDGGMENFMQRLIRSSHLGVTSSAF